MKLKTAQKHVKTITERLNESSGELGPMIVTRAYIFGSTVKGAEKPKDVDILLETKFNHKYGVYGLNIWKDFESSLRKLRSNMKKISFHIYSIDADFGDIKETMLMIYPENKYII